jgi:retron-type reverse transcriptase
LASEELPDPITFLVNESIKQGIVPYFFKVSCVLPIYKNGDPTNPSNYRPIAILPSFNKIYERIVYDQLLKFLNKYNIIHKHQFGFRKNHSTEQAILELTDTLKKSIDNN